MSDNSNSKNNISRRSFLKTMGIAGLATAGISSCTGGKTSQGGESGTPLGEMTYRTNPTTGDRVSLLGFGMMRLPHIPVPGGAEGEQMIDQEAVNRMVDYAIEHGVNYFDTSPNYCKGKSEQATGIALSRHPREKYFVSTKLSNFASSTWSKEASTAMYQNSMKQLQVEYIDYLLLHSIGRSMEDFENRFIKNGMLDFLLEERKAGRIRNLGFSFHGDVAVFDWMMANHDKYKWDFALIQMNYLDWKHGEATGNVNAEYLYGELSKRGIPNLIMEPLLGGRLANLPQNIVDSMKQREPERSVASWAFRFAGSHSNVLSVLSGMTRLEHLQDNVRTFSPLKPVNEEEFEFLQYIVERILQFPTIPCTDCKYCMPCPYGLDIPAIFRHYNKCVNEGNVPASSQDENYRKARRAYLVGYDRSVPALRQADRCIGCGQCVKHCPQRIKIPRELRRIDNYIEQLKQNTL